MYVDDKLAVMSIGFMLPNQDVGAGAHHRSRRGHSMLLGHDTSHQQRAPLRRGGGGGRGRERRSTTPQERHGIRLIHWLEEAGLKGLADRRSLRSMRRMRRRIGEEEEGQAEKDTTGLLSVSIQHHDS